MKLAMYSYQGSAPKIGLLKEDKVLDVTKASEILKYDLPETIEELLQKDKGLEDLEAFIKKYDTTHWDGYAVSDIKFLSPISSPKKMICVGLNYKHHIIEMGRDMPTIPVLFGKFPNTLNAHNGDIPYCEFSDTLDYEAELAVVIGKKAKNVSKEDAFDYIAGYSCFNDVTVREYQKQTIQWMQGKNFDGHGPLGPYLVTKDEIDDLAPLKIQSILNGNVMQESSIGDLIFDIPTLIEFTSKIMTLEPGDVIATGTPSGVGFARTPKLFMQPGDKIQVSIDKIGTLTNTVQKVHRVLTLKDMQYIVERGQASMLNTLSNTPDSSLFTKPSEKEWSIGVVLLHMAEAREYFVKEVEKAIASPDDKVGRTMKSEVRLKAIAEAEKATASRADIIKRLEESLATVTDCFMRLNDSDLERTIHHVHPKFGDMSMHDFVDHFIVEHNEIHDKQAQRVFKWLTEHALVN